tara:strand:+ start:219 stop:500 length:282 start_codon:yes stop_codon:yes gene_type:complete
MNKKKQVKPKWFNGAIYLKGTTVRNPYSGEAYELNALELSIYDFIMGASMTLERAYDRNEEPNKRLKKITKDLYKGLNWFRKNNVDAYMVLLD